MGYIRARIGPGNVTSVQTRRTDHVARNVAFETARARGQATGQMGLIGEIDTRNVYFRRGRDGHRIRNCSFEPTQTTYEGGFDGRRKT